MKRAYLIVTVFFLSTVCFSQVEKITDFTDIDLARAVIGKKYDQIEKTIETYDVAYWVTERSDCKCKMVIYISYGQSVREWRLHIGLVMRDIGGTEVPVAMNVVEEIFVRYKHDSFNDLEAFFAYEKPEDEKYRIYEKELGTNMSHLRVVQH